MRKSATYGLLAIAVFAAVSCAEKHDSVTARVCYSWKVDSVSTDFSKYVDPMIGTAGHGHTFPGACAPFGMVQVSPDTRVDGSWDGCSGYHYDDSVIYGFSHTHLSGTGCSDYGDILFMPGTGEVNFNNGADGKPGYRSHFSHTREKANAGYYDVFLDDSKTEVELTASPRAGLHRYSFSGDNGNWVLLDLTHRDEVIDSKIELVNDHTIKGYRYSKAWANHQQLYFYAEFSEPFESFPEVKTKADSSFGKSVKWAFKFNKKSVTLKVAISPVSCDNAALNMQTEVPDFDFDAVKKKVQQQWNAELGKIEVKSDDEHKLRTFYTALYHCFVSPNLYCDVNGDYRGMDNNIHTDTIHPQYTVFSLWDTYRALHPLFTIIQPKRDQDFINTFLKQYKEGGTLPVWELSANETNCMIGYHSVPVIVDAWMKGLTDFDTALAYEAMKHSAMSDEHGLKAYKKFGFIPAEGESESVSRTLEYAYDDWCISLAAQRMKKMDDYAYFRHRSESWRNLFDPLTGFMRARLNNAFVEPFDPNEVNFHYTEANAWQYSLAVQQDIPGLIAAHGGDKKFIAFLDKLFSTSSQTSGRNQADISGMIGQYAQGNEPSHHMAYLYDYTSEPWKTQQLVSKICSEQYSDKPDGLCGNEDCGQMSAWYVMSMMGMYEVSPGVDNAIAEPAFEITEPGFERIQIHLESGKTFEINNLTNNSMSKINEGYEGGYFFGNAGRKSVLKNQIKYAEVEQGGEFNIGKVKNDFSKVNVCADQATIPLPPRVQYTFVQSAAGAQNTPVRTFVNDLHIKFYEEPGLNYFISRNGRVFKEETVLFSIDSTTTLRAFTQNSIGQHSDTVEFHYTKIPGGRSIKLNTKYENQYTAGGDEALIDGIKGTANFRTGEWQGYEGKNVDAVVDLGSMQYVSRISISFLQDQGSWIFMPVNVSFYVSADGKTFVPVQTIANDVDPHHDGPVIKTFSAVLVSDKTLQYRYVRVVAVNTGQCPQWHPGKGNPAWLFADEIEIETK